MGGIYRRRTRALFKMQVLAERGLAMRIRILWPLIGPKKRSWWMPSDKHGCFLEDDGSPLPDKMAQLKSGALRKLCKELELIDDKAMHKEGTKNESVQPR